jgi:hypothetical protein
MTLQLWELLIERGETRPLSCLDCLAVMELLALGLESGVDRAALENAAWEHLARCPGCREKLATLLDELEMEGVSDGDD